MGLVHEQFVGEQFVEPVGHASVLNSSDHVVFVDFFGHLDLVVREIVVDVSHLSVLQGGNGGGLTPVVAVFQDHGGSEKGFFFGGDDVAGAGRGDRQSAQNAVLFDK